jgi:hypothetical protein
VLGLLAAFTAAEAQDWTAARLLAFADDSCRGWEETAAPASGYASAEISITDLRFGEVVVGRRYRVPVANNALVELDVVERAQRPVRFVASLYHESGDPLLLISLASDCSLQAGRQLNYSRQGQALNIVSLDVDLEPVGEPDWLNPPLQFIERVAPPPLKHPGDSMDSMPLRVAMVDSGVNYRLAEINRRLARDGSGQLIGYDFWEMDALPYDSHPVNSGFFVQRHGTRTASLLLREAPGIELVAYRYPRPDMSRMQALVEHAAANGVAIVGMPLGSNRAEDWGGFARAASAHPQMLFIVSAGNDGRDIDARPVFPAALDLENMLVVTSADDFVRPAERSNWGRVSVDFMVPAERRNALDYTASETLVSGSSYAVSRVVALAARLKGAHPDWAAVDIIDALRQRYGQDGPDVSDWVGGGYIADPLAPTPIHKTPLADFEPGLESTGSGFRLALEVLQLDPQWSAEGIAEALREAYRILAQCDIVPGDVLSYAIRADDYMLDLSTGSARSLLEAVAARQPTVVFARDTRMAQAYLGEAFGLSNTERRRWLANSVWLMRDIDDAGIALAHELYHVLANSGAHVESQPNLMQPDTRPQSTDLTPQQCSLAQVMGVENGLLNRE